MKIFSKRKLQNYKRFFNFSFFPICCKLVNKDLTPEQVVTFREEN